MSNVRRESMYRKNDFSKDIDRLDDECAIDFSEEKFFKKTTSRAVGYMGIGTHFHRPPLYVEKHQF